MLQSCSWAAIFQIWFLYHRRLHQTAIALSAWSVWSTLHFKSRKQVGWATHDLEPGYFYIWPISTAYKHRCVWEDKTTVNVHSHSLDIQETRKHRDRPSNRKSVQVRFLKKTDSLNYFIIIQTTRIYTGMGEGYRTTDKSGPRVMLGHNIQYLPPNQSLLNWSSLNKERVSIVAILWGLPPHTSGASQYCFYIVLLWRSASERERERSTFRRTSLILLNWSTQDLLFCLE